VAAIPLGLARGRAKRALPLWWLVTASRGALLARGHWLRLAPGDRRRLRELLAKSRGRPSNLTLGERDDVRRLVSNLGIRDLASDLYAMGSPLPWPRGRRRRD
jgi:hypothetical protein